MANPLEQKINTDMVADVVGIDTYRDLNQVSAVLAPSTTTTTTRSYIHFKQSPLYSLPLRMPGKTLQVQSSKPQFQVTLRGGGDEQGLFETSQSPNKWQSNSLHYALGRVVYDIVFPDTVHKEATEIKLCVNYSVLIPDEKTQNIKLSLRRWDFNFTPHVWYKLPKSEHLIRKLYIRDKNTLDVSVVPPFKVAVAGVPLRLFKQSSEKGHFDFTNIPETECNGILVKGGLDFSQVFGAWVVFDKVPEFELEISYDLEK